jgi:PAS domain S-box-containing protein
MDRKPTYEELERKIEFLESQFGKGNENQTAKVGRISEDYKRLADHSQDAIYRYDIPSSQFLFFNRSGAEYGYGSKKDTLRLIHPDDREKVKKASKESLLPGRQGGEVEYRICPSNGSIRWMHDRWIVTRTSSGSPLAIEGVIRDNTRQKISEQELKESRERYRTLVETMNEGLAVQDENYIISYVNDKFCEMLDYGYDEFIGTPLVDFIDKSEQKIFFDQMAKRKRGEHTQYELTWNRKDGRKVQTIVSPQCMFDENGKFMGSFGVMTDISIRKQVERVLRESEKELEMKTRYLEELNSALKVLLKRREDDKQELEQNVVANVRELVAPYIRQLKGSRLEERQRSLVLILESNLKEIVSPFLSRVSMNLLNLTPTETQVANFVKQGKTTKEIADMLGLSPRTIESHRESIRKKLGIKNKKSNLRTHLLSFQTKSFDPEILSVF